MTGLLLSLIIGAIAGWLAGLFMKGGGYGLIGDIVVGIIGGVLGGWLFGVLHIPVPGDPLVARLIVAFVGAVILIFLVRLIKRA